MVTLVTAENVGIRCWDTVQCSEVLLLSCIVLRAVRGLWPDVNASKPGIVWLKFSCACFLCLMVISTLNVLMSYLDRDQVDDVF